MRDDKFDDVMTLLFARNAGFQHVIAVDEPFGLFTRAWCVAEVAQAHAMGLEQSLVLCGSKALARREAQLRGLRVQDMKATRPEDVEEILAKIPDKEEFNNRLQELIFDPNDGLVASWRCLDTSQLWIRIGRMARWQWQRAVFDARRDSFSRRRRSSTSSLDGKDAGKG